MPPYQHIPLSNAHDSVRLLRLLPAVSEESKICVEIFEYSLQKSKHSYEALSYVWGAEDPAQFVYIDDQPLKITPNLHSALRQLRDHSFPRVIWIDAICINQQDEKEKGTQIQSMARIYASAKRVVVYLGEAVADSDEALEAIRAAGIRPSSDSSEKTSEAVKLLLQRQWFRRIWVLQEVAAARYIVIMCGNTEIDGHAFCLGLDNFKFVDEYAAAYYQVRPVLSLVGESIFRPKFIMKNGATTSLDICSLGELVSMYNTHKASQPLDKIFALLGMASQDNSDRFKEHGLLPDYSVGWGEMLRRMGRFILGDKIHIQTQEGVQRAQISGTGHVLGSVSSVTRNSFGYLTAQISEARPSYQTDNSLNGFTSYQTNDSQNTSTWTMRVSANEVRQGDIIWLFEGALEPMIIRRVGMNFYLVMIEVPSQQHDTSSLASRDVVIVWDWLDLQEENFSAESTEAMNYWTTALMLYDSTQRQRGNKLLGKLIAMSSGRDKGNSSEHMTDSILVELMRFCNDKRAVQVLSWMKKNKIYITESVLVSIVQHRSERLASRVLDHYHGPIRLTEEVLVTLVTTHTEDLAIRLVEKNRDTISVTERVMLAIMSNRVHMNRLLETVLNMRGYLLPVRGRLTSEACEECEECGECEEHPNFDYILRNSVSGRIDGMDVEITDAVLFTAARNCFSSEIIRDLVRDVDVKAAPLIAALKNRYASVSATAQLEALLSCKGTIDITAAVLESAAENATAEFGCSHLKMLLDEHSETRLQVTGAVLLAAVRNRSQPCEVLQMLLVDRADELDFPDGKVTPVLLEAAAQESPHGLHVVDFLLDLDSDDTNITEAVITAAMKNWALGDLIIPLLCRQGSKARELYLSIIASGQDEGYAHFTANLADAPTRPRIWGGFCGRPVIILVNEEGEAEKLIS